MVWLRVVLIVFGGVALGQGREEARALDEARTFSLVTGCGSQHALSGFGGLGEEVVSYGPDEGCSRPRSTIGRSGSGLRVTAKARRRRRDRA